MIFYLFIITGIIDIYVYYPIIKDLIKHPEETSINTNLKAWFWWFISGLISTIYYAIEIGDIATIFLSLSHTIVCFVVAFLVFKFKLKYQKDFSIKKELLTN